MLFVIDAFSCCDLRDFFFGFTCCVARKTYHKNRLNFATKRVAITSNSNWLVLRANSTNCFGGSGANNDSVVVSSSCSIDDQLARQCAQISVVPLVAMAVQRDRCCGGWLCATGLCAAISDAVPADAHLQAHALSPVRSTAARPLTSVQQPQRHRHSSVLRGAVERREARAILRIQQRHCRRQIAQRTRQFAVVARRNNRTWQRARLTNASGTPAPSRAPHTHQAAAAKHVEGR